MEFEDKYISSMVGIILGGAVISYIYVEYYWESSRFDSLVLLAIAFGLNITIWPAITFELDKDKSFLEVARSTVRDIKDAFKEELRVALWSGLGVVDGIVFALIYLPFWRK